MNHLHINVPNVAEAQLFFERYFNFRRVFPESANVFLMDPREFLLALDALNPGENVTFPAWFHFGFCKNDPEWARTLYAQMRADGVPICRDMRESEHAAVFFCRGPGGYSIEVRGNK
jgi:catechol 2,3-dioxygenase-like lactoylglutathione lyase family enzyme